MRLWDKWPIFDLNFFFNIKLEEAQKILLFSLDGLSFSSPTLGNVYVWLH